MLSPVQSLTTPGVRKKIGAGDRNAICCGTNTAHMYNITEYYSLITVITITTSVYKFDFFSLK